MKKNTFLLVLIVSVWSFSCRSDKAETGIQNLSETSVELMCEAFQDSEDAPAASVFLKTGDRKTKIAQINGNCSVIETGEYANYDMPAGTLSAVGSWWAGSGEYLYAVLENEKIVVYQGFADEMQEEPGFHYNVLVVYDGKKYVFMNAGSN